MAEKICGACKRARPLDAFYRDWRTANGHLAKCIDCTRRIVRQNRLTNIEHYRDYDQARNTDPKRVLAHAEYNRSDRGRAVAKEKNRRWKEKNPEKRYAQYLLNYRRRSDPTFKPQPCAKCGNPITQAHHGDYSKPFDVVWLCAKHHNEHHRNLKKGVKRDANTSGLTIGHLPRLG